jgi:hypothetical protein
MVATQNQHLAWGIMVMIHEPLKVGMNNSEEHKHIYEFCMKYCLQLQLERCVGTEVISD